MKPQIVFVDDEPLVLQGLQRSMRSMRNEWDMAFLDNAAAALAFMAEAPVSVIVSDMRMPVMNGAQLLGEVMKRHPKTVRLILSGHADQELILQCVGSTHQFLSKPCDPEQLRATVRRAMDLEANLKNEGLQQLVGRMEHLPSVPSLYSEIVDKMHDPEVVLEDVGAIIAKDAGMTAKVLKLVNSAFFGLRREVSSPAEAVSYLGLDTIKSLVLSMHAFSQFETASAAGFSLAAVWNHSMATAAAAKQITQIEANDRKMMDEAFVAGLLHDAGKIALAFNFPDEYTKVMAQTQTNSGDLIRAEQEILGANHADVAGYLLGLWGLPTPVVEAIALHHHPNITRNDNFSPLTAVHIANALLNTGPDQAPALDLKYLDRLHLAGDPTIWRETLLKPATPE
jgi:HD-like signal output (HDOD) protein/CheY-like chemotaxis protein